MSLQDEFQTTMTGEMVHQMDPHIAPGPLMAAAAAPALAMPHAGAGIKLAPLQHFSRAEMGNSRARGLDSCRDWCPTRQKCCIPVGWKTWTQLALMARCCPSLLWSVGAIYTLIDCSIRVPYAFPTERSKMIFIISHLSGSAWVWAKFQSGVPLHSV